jgi:hypothetical protein
LLWSKKHEQTTIKLGSLSEIFRIKLKAFLPHLFSEEQLEAVPDVVDAPICHPTREFATIQ